MAGAGSDDTNTQHINPSPQLREQSHARQAGSNLTRLEPHSGMQGEEKGGLAKACGTTNKMGPAGHFYRCVGIVEWSEGHSAWSGLQVMGPGMEAVGWGM